MKEIENGMDLLELAEKESAKHSIEDGKSLLNERYHFEKGYIKGYQKAQQGSEVELISRLYDCLKKSLNGEPFREYSHLCSEVEKYLEDNYQKPLN